MKNYISLGLIVLLLSSCSATYYVKHAKYEKAFEKAIVKLHKNPEHEKSILALRSAYNHILKKQYDRIAYLKAQKRDDLWSDIFHIYNHLKYLQEQLESVLPLRLHGKEVSFPHTDYDKEMISAKKIAADFYVRHGKQMLAKGDRFSARKAYEDFQQLKKFFPNFKNVDELLQKAYQQGLTNVLIDIDNRSFYNLSPAFLESLLPRDYEQLNGKWQSWHEIPQQDNDDYEVRISIEKIVLSPGLVKEKEYTETKEVDDGWEYELDENGNVKKDSLGNDIKVPKTKVLEALVKEYTRRREGHSKVEITFYALPSGQRLKKVPANIVFFFENQYATLSGDLKAASDRTRELMQQSPLPFPSDQDMLDISAEPLQKRIEDLLEDHRYLLK